MQLKKLEIYIAELAYSRFKNYANSFSILRHRISIVRVATSPEKDF